MRNASISSLSGPRERSDSCASTSSSGSGTLCHVPANNKMVTSCDIVKTGHLHVKRPPTNGSVKIRIKTWQKRYLVLRDQSYHKGSACLEIYCTDTGWEESRDPPQDCYTVDLTTVTHTDDYTDSRNHPHAFTMTRHGHGPLVLAAESEYDLKEWKVAIQVLSDKVKISNNNNVSPARRPSCPPRISQWGSAQHLHGDHNSDSGDSGEIRLLRIPGTSCASSQDCVVTIHPTEDSLSAELSGDYLMVIMKDEIFLRKPGTVAEVISWRIPLILKFKSEDESDGTNLLTLEASSQSGRSAGKYLFHTCHGRRIIQKVKDAVARQEAAPEKTHDRELERLRQRPLCKMPSTPNLLSRGSPPKISSRGSLDVPSVQQTVAPTQYADITHRRHSDGPPPEVPTRQRKTSDAPPKTNSYLDLMGEVPPTSEDSDIPPVVPENKPTPKSSPHLPKRKLSKLPPLPPSATDRSSSPSLAPDRPSPPRGSADIPPARPPRKISRSPPQTTRSLPPVARSPPPVIRNTDRRSPPTIVADRPTLNVADRPSPPLVEASTQDGAESPPPPPPRPQHTLGTKSLPV